MEGLSWINHEKTSLIVVNCKYCLKISPEKISKTRFIQTSVIYKFQCGLWNQSYYGECVRHFNVRIGGCIVISPLTKKQVKPKNNSVVNHLPFCNHSASYDDFSLLMQENKTFILELKGNLLTMR